GDAAAGEEVGRARSVLRDEGGLDARLPALEDLADALAQERLLVLGEEVERVEARDLLVGVARGLREARAPSEEAAALVIEVEDAGERLDEAPREAALTLRRGLRGRVLGAAREVLERERQIA